jgi:hypothetical protein
VISRAGKRLQTVVVETNGRALVEAIRMIPGHKHLCFEEGTQSAWLYEILTGVFKRQPLQAPPGFFVAAAKQLAQLGIGTAA